LGRMLKLKKLAVTGSLGSGKTLVCKILSELGAFTVNADELAHQFLTSDSACIHKVELLFGSEIESGHQIDRKKLARLVFADAKKLDLLEKILHPLVFKRMETLYVEACASPNQTLFVVEVPLLFEAKWESFFDAIMVVESNDLLCRKRALAQGLSSKDYELRLKRLLPMEEKIKRADYIVHNNTTQENLKQQIVEIVKTINTGS
jgi:dephospho-CoA kinase